MEPRTEIDERFSDPEASATTWDDARQVLEGAQLSWLTTVRSDGRPHVTPLVSVWLDDAVFFCTGAEEQKALNLRTNPRVVLMTGCNTHDRGLDVMVEGEAVRVTEPSHLQRLADEWAKKWSGEWRFDVGDGGLHSDDGGDALVFAVQPAKVLAFGKGPYSHTRHVF